MTYRNKLIASFAASGVLALLLVSSLVLSPENAQRRSAKGSLVASSKPESVAELKIVAEGKTIRLKKVQSEWFLSEGENAPAEATYPAQKVKVENFLKAVFETTELYAVTSNKDSWASFELEEGKAKKVSILDDKGKSLGEFFVGKYDPSGDSVYLRKTGKDAVYSSSRSFVSFVTADTKYWSYLRLFPDAMKEKDVVSVSVKSNFILDKENGKELLDEYTIQRDKKAVWAVQGDVERQLNPDAVSSMVRSLISVEAEGYAQAGDSGFEKPSVKVKLTAGNGEEYVFVVGKEKEEGKYYATMEGGKYPFLVSKWTLESAVKNLVDLEAKKN